MEKKTYNRFNFHKHTFCEFIEQDIASISALQIHYKSKSGSSYSYTEEGVYRSSNHWGRASNCRWRLVSSSSSKINNFKNRVGFAKWSDFYPNNETEKLFYIEVNFYFYDKDGHGKGKDKVYFDYSIKNEYGKLLSLVNHKDLDELCVTDTEVNEINYIEIVNSAIDKIKKAV